jgi:MOSC domain-containing protein YiiM
VESLLINQSGEESFNSQSKQKVLANYSGFVGDAHSGLTRESCVRVKEQYATGTEIRNVRQVSILSLEELEKIALNMNLETIKPEWVIANLVVSGIPDFTLLPPSTRLIFPSGASLVIDMENGPCAFPGSIIEQYHPEKGKSFARSALSCRGVTAWVEREGSISTGDKIAVHAPLQTPYPHKLF